MGGKCWNSRPAHREFIRLPLPRQRTNAIDGVANQLWWIEGVPYVWVLSFRSCTSLSTHFWAPPPTRQNAATPGSCSSTCPYCRPSGEWRWGRRPYRRSENGWWRLEFWNGGDGEVVLIRVDAGNTHGSHIRSYLSSWYLFCYTWKRVNNAILFSLRFSQV